MKKDSLAGPLSRHGVKNGRLRPRGLDPPHRQILLNLHSSVQKTAYEAQEKAFRERREASQQPLVRTAITGAVPVFPGL